MDPNPAPVPGLKRRVTMRSSLKQPTVRPKTVKKEKQTQAVAPAAPRPKRAFGVSRNTNVPVEKTQVKQRKPVGAVVKPANPIEGKKQLQPVQLKKDNEKKQEETMRTPLAVAKRVVEDGTPYLSALNCSKCRLDRLETSSYWLNQIRLSEAVGKHFVSATFFRLALECHAQPFEKIRSELKHYTKRHQTSSTISLFNDLLQSYGLSAEKPKSECSETLIHELKKEVLFLDTQKDELKMNTDVSLSGAENITLKEEHGDCDPNQGVSTDLSPEQPNSEQKQDEIVQPEHCCVGNIVPIQEMNDKPKQHVLKDSSNSASDRKAVKKFDKKSPPTRGSQSNKISSACLGKSNSTERSGISTNEQSKSKGKQTKKNEKTECVSKTTVEEPMKDEVVFLTDSLVTQQGTISQET